MRPETQLPDDSCTGHRPSNPEAGRADFAAAAALTSGSGTWVVPYRMTGADFQAQADAEVRVHDSETGGSSDSPVDVVLLPDKSRVELGADPDRPPRLPRRRESLVRLSRKLPVPALFGLRLVARRPRRAILSAASIAVTIMGLVAALSIHAGVDNELTHFGNSGGLVNPDIPRAEQVLTVLTILLVTLAVLTAIFTTLATVLDARRASALTLALGATPQQVRAGLAMTQVIPALPGAILGLPLGLGLYEVAAQHGVSGLPPVLWLVAAVLGTVGAVAALTSVPARIGLRRPVAEMLQTEAT